MLMIPSPSSREITKIPSWTTSTQWMPTSSLPVKIPKQDGSISFLDILIIPEEDGKLNTTIFRKPTHTDMYLHWDSHHNIPSKYSVIGTLYHRANTICSTTQYLQDEEKHLSQDLKKCKYPPWAINRVRMKTRTTTSQNSNRRTSNIAQSSNPNIKHCSALPSGLK